MLEKTKAAIIAWFIRGIVADENTLRQRAFIAFTRPKVNKFFKEVEKMETKSKWKSKAVWTAIIGVVLGAIQPVSTALGHPIAVPIWVYEILGFYGLYALRDGQGKTIQ